MQASDMKDPDKKSLSGRSVFFVNSNDMIHNELVMPLLLAEYRVYEIDSYDAVIELVKNFPDAVIIFYLANAKSDFSFNECSKVIEKIYNSRSYNKLRIGIICDTKSVTLRRTALYNAGINGVFLSLSDGCGVVLNNILKSLELISARGSHQYVSVRCIEEDAAEISWTHNDKTLVGTVVEISSAGCLVRFDNDPKLDINLDISDIKINIRGTAINMSGRVTGTQQSDNNTDKSKEYMILFNDDCDDAEKSKIYNHIYYSLRRDFKQ